MALSTENLLEEYKKLVTNGLDLLNCLSEEINLIKGKNSKTQEKVNDYEKYRFHLDYQSWYTQSLEVVSQLLPSRREEFITLYQGNKVRKYIDAQNFTIQDWLLGYRKLYSIQVDIIDDYGLCVFYRFKSQIDIFSSIEKRFTSSIFDIKSLVMADVFDSELEAAMDLTLKGFLRGAGAIAGVVLEKHFISLCKSHKISIKKVKHQQLMISMNYCVKIISLIL